MRYKALALGLFMVMLVSMVPLASAGAGDNWETFVQAQTNIRAPTDIGTHSSFAEMQDKDGTFDTLTEGDTGGAGGTTEYIASAFSDTSGKWTGDTNTYDGDWGTAATYTSGAFVTADETPTAYSSGFDSGASGTGTITQVDIVVRHAITGLDASDRWAITLDVGASTDNDLQAWSTANYALNNQTFTDVTEPNGGGWSWAEVQSAQIHFDCDKVGGGDKGDWAIYELSFKVTVSGASNYDLDLEVGWTTADFDETNEELCIFGGTQGAEALRVDIWDDVTTNSWVNVFTDIAAGWNNISLNSGTDYLHDATFEIRFTDTSDESTLADTWQVEGVLLHVWTASGASYEVTVSEVLDVYDSTSTSVELSATINEVLELYDSVTTAVSLSTTISELLEIFDSVTTAVSFRLTISELLELYDSVLAVVPEGGFYSIVINEIVTIYDSVKTALETGVTINEILEIFDSVTAVMNPVVIITVVINEVINILDSVISQGGLEGLNIFYDLFLSANMWGYIGPVGLVVIGFFITQKEKSLGIFMIIIYSLLISQYLALVSANPNYWWQTIILLLGVLQCTIQLIDRR